MYNLFLILTVVIGSRDFDSPPILFFTRPDCICCLRQCDWAETDGGRAPPGAHCPHCNPHGPSTDYSAVDHQVDPLLQRVMSLHPHIFPCVETIQPTHTHDRHHTPTVYIWTRNCSTHNTNTCTHTHLHVFVYFKQTHTNLHTLVRAQLSTHTLYMYTWYSAHNHHHTYSPHTYSPHTPHTTHIPHTTHTPHTTHIPHTHHTHHTPHTPHTTHILTTRTTHSPHTPHTTHTTHYTHTHHTHTTPHTYHIYHTHCTHTLVSVMQLRGHAP